ncbi:DUF4231 domain-containing protein [Kribbella sp. C-35]|uniref:DUF4231 domain-containing protein n=1 Tax=Kribbella sp. C-35 TaxID=2789276 RepID=UPI00397E2987
MTVPKSSSAGTITDDDLPGLHDAGDKASLEGQRYFVVASGIKLGLAASAAVVSAFSGPRGLAIAVAGLFLGVLCAEAWLWARKPERRWYDGRAFAESAKTMAWRFAVGAAPYLKTDATAEDRYLADLHRLLDDGPKTDIYPSNKPPISNAMEHVRGLDLHDRRSVYLRDRIDVQLNWYRTKALLSRKRSTQWRTALIAAEGLGVFFAFGRASDLIPIDAGGIIAAFVGAGAAWLGIRQHENLQRAYTYASQELSIARAALERCTSDTEWPQLVADTEEAISREHTMWRASRSSS